MIQPTNDRNAYEELMFQVARGNITGIIPIEVDGQPCLFTTTAVYQPSDPRDIHAGLVAAAAIIKRAYREAHKEGLTPVV